MTVVGTSLPMPDAVQRVVGTVPFVLDHHVPGMVHGKAVRSTQPHARLRGVDVTAARRAPGVVGVVTGADLAAADGIDPYFGVQRPDQPALAIDKVRYAGEPVAVVVARTPQEAAAAAELVTVDYEPLEHVVDPVAAMRPGAPVVHDAWPDNECGTYGLHRGDVAQGFAEADRVYEATYVSPPVSHVPMEPFVCVATWHDDAPADGSSGAGGTAGGRLELFTATQAPHFVRPELARMFGLAPGDVRVRTANLGGGYGAKGHIKIEPMVACVARLVGRPVRMELARDEVFLTVGKHGAHVRVKTGVKLDGTITAREMELIYNAGAYAITSPAGAGQGLTRAPGPYRIPNISVTSTCRYTNTVPSCPFRGAMTSQVSLAYEAQLDEIAMDLGIDGVEIRRRNLLRDGDTYATGEVMHDLHYDELLDAAAAAIGWDQPLPPAPEGWLRGRGIALMIKSTLTPSRSEARVELSGDGAVRLFHSSIEMGQGADGTMQQLLADELGVRPDAIDMPFPDTDLTPFDTTTSSSRATSSMGAAIADAATALRQELGRLAAKHWDTTPEHVDVGDGQVAFEGDALSYAALLAAVGTEQISATGVFQSEGGMKGLDPMNVQGKVTVHWHQGAAAVEVLVERETGRVRIPHCHGAAYAGRVVNPLRVRQQNEGGAIYGLGPTLFEELVYSGGQLTNPNLSDYMIPSIVDVPERMTSTAVESDDPRAEMHGVGEMSLPAVAPAVASAIARATGVQLRRVPMTAERVLRALEGVDDEQDR
ncbi:MAG TPA: xanthine dehydrogenase family protein molybdopterin-binding subunit [Euzebyales bacterium]|nr:xanthine dehydrogenase family protein molybdopterin-binding subunit [Euzebyales bacterium]